MLAETEDANSSDRRLNSSVSGCPDSYVDCGTCLCVPESTCQWCPDPVLPTHSENLSVTSPSTIYGCPENYVDCGTCLCVPESTCQWCPNAAEPEHPAPPASESNVP